MLRSSWWLVKNKDVIFLHLISDPPIHRSLWGSVGLMLRLPVLVGDEIK